MNKLAVLMIVSAGITASHAVPTFAQSPPRLFPRRGQSNNVYSPNPAFAPPVLPPRTRVVVDARGNQFLAVEHFVSVWDPSRGRWILQSTQELRTPATNQSRPPVTNQSASGTNQIGRSTPPGHAAPATNQSRPPVTHRSAMGTNQIGRPTPPSFAAQGTSQIGQSAAQGTNKTKPTIHPELTAAQGTNQIGQSAAQGTNKTKPTIHPELTAAQGTNQIGQPANANNAPLQPQAGAVAMGTNAFGQPSNANNPPQAPVTAGPQPLYAANLGIYYDRVRYENGTFGARLTSAPVPGKPASALPLDTNDVIFLLNDQRFTKSDDLLNHFGQTTVGYIDSSTNTTQSGTITLPPQGS